MKKLAMLTALVLVALPLMAAALIMPGVMGTRPAQAAVTTNIKIPVDIGEFIPCANGGAGDFVVLSGNLHILFTFTADSAGGFHFSGHFQPQGISGVGLFSGDKYQATGVTRFNSNAKPPFPNEFTFVNNFRIIGQRPGNNLLVHETVHMTVNANGAVTADVANTSFDCK